MNTNMQPLKTKTELDSTYSLYDTVDMKKVYSATEARKEFFKILNIVLNDDEVIFIKKEGFPKMVRLESVPERSNSIFDMKEGISDEDAEIMLKAIEKSRKIPSRKVDSFD